MITDVAFLAFHITAFFMRKRFALSPFWLVFNTVACGVWALALALDCIWMRWF